MKNTVRNAGVSAFRAALLMGVVGLFSALLLADDPEQFSDWLERTDLGAANTVSADFFPNISKDGLSLYLTVATCPGAATCLPDPQASGGFDLYVSQRASVDEPWGSPQNLGPTINTPYDEVAPGLTIDGHFLFFASTRPGGFGGNDIYVARRRDKRDDFGWEAPGNLGDGVNTPFNESGPEIFEADSGVVTLYFDSNRPADPTLGGPFTDDSAHNGTDIWASLLEHDGTFGPAVFVPELSSTSVERQPAIRRDGLEMFITSNRPGGFGLLDVWVFTRASTSAPWATPVNAGPVVNGVTNDAGADLSFDGTTLYFQSQRSPGALFDLFQATRTKLKGRR
jgi:WD40 repeat protein